MKAIALMGVVAACLACSIMSMDESPQKPQKLTGVTHDLPYMAIGFPSHLIFHPHQNLLACATDCDTKVFLFDCTDKLPEKVATFDTKKRDIKISLSPDGTFLAAQNKFGGRYIWDITTKSLVHAKSCDVIEKKLCIKYSPDGKYLMVAAGKKIKQLCAQSFEIVKEYKLADDCSSFALSRDGYTIASSTAAGLELFDLRSDEKKILKSERPECNSLAFKPDGSELVGLCSGSLVIWSTQTNTVRNERKIDWHVSSLPHNLYYTHDGKWLLFSNSSDLSIAETDNYRTLYCYKPNKEVRGLAVDSQEKHFAHGDFGNDEWSTLVMTDLKEFEKKRQALPKEH